MTADDTSSARSALLLSMLFLVSIFSVPGMFPSANAEYVTHFGNSGFPQSVNITFPGDGYDTSTTLILGANSVVSAASLDVRGWQGAAGQSPTTIGIDVGDDGDLEWAFGGSGNGSFGHVDELSNGYSKAPSSIQVAIRLIVDSERAAAFLGICAPDAVPLSF